MRISLCCFAAALLLAVSGCGGGGGPGDPAGDGARPWRGPLIRPDTSQVPPPAWDRPAGGDSTNSVSSAPARVEEPPDR